MLLHLQQVSDSSNETGHCGTGNSGLVGRTGEWRGGWCWLAGVGGRRRLIGRDGAVGIDWSGASGGGVNRGGSNRNGALSGADTGWLDGGIDLGNSARAVGDSQSGGLGDSIGLVVLHNGSRTWAVGGVSSDNLGGCVLSAVLNDAGRGTSNDRENSGNGSETHFD